MDFNLTEQQKLMQKLFREVAQNEVKENAADVDENERFPKENVEVMRQAVEFRRGGAELIENRAVLVP